MFSRSFTAPTFLEFWRYWNPVYGYALLYFCYAPLRRVLPKALSLVVTFAVSGFLFHDLLVWVGVRESRPHLRFPLVTVAFVLLALFALVADRARLSLRAASPSTRAACHVVIIACAFALAIGCAMLFTVPAG